MARILPNEAIQLGLPNDQPILAGPQGNNLLLTSPQCNYVQDRNTSYLTTYQWITDRLVNQVNQSEARFEYSLYGPLLYLLLSQFPPKRHFMISPQAGFRVVEQGQARQVQTHGRISSHGTPIQPETYEIAGDLPDFVLNKVTSQISSDIILCIVEVKRDGKQVSANENQIQRYLKRAAREKYCVGKLYGFLIEGAETSIYCIDAESHYTYAQNQAAQRNRNNRPTEPLDPYLVGFCSTSGSLKKKLCQISSFFWGNPQNNWLTSAGCARLNVLGD